MVVLDVDRKDRRSVEAQGQCSGPFGTEMGRAGTEFMLKKASDVVDEQEF